MGVLKPLTDAFEKARTFATGLYSGESAEIGDHMGTLAALTHISAANGELGAALAGVFTLGLAAKQVYERGLTARQNAAPVLAQA